MPIDINHPITIAIETRLVKPSVKELHNMGYNSRYLRLDAYVVGKWRAMKYLTPKQYQQRQWEKEVSNRIRTNTSAPVTTYYVFAILRPVPTIEE